MLASTTQQQQQQQSQNNVIQLRKQQVQSTTTVLMENDEMGRDDDDDDDEDIGGGKGETDENQENQENEEDYGEDEAAKLKKMRKRDETESDVDGSSENYDYQENENETTKPAAVTTTKTTTATTKRINNIEQQQMSTTTSSSSSSNNNNKPHSVRSKTQSQFQSDYVYITRLWPFTVAKSPFTECIAYEKLPLKLSVAYLLQPHKEPIIGQIHYGAYYAATAKTAAIATPTSSTTSCNGQIGFTKCLMQNECVLGATCDGITDCPDQSDEQFCDHKVCRTAQSGGYQCDNRCWPNWTKCDQQPHCFNLSDEISADCPTKSFKLTALFAGNLSSMQPWTWSGLGYQPPPHHCFRHSFDLKSARLIRKESLKYLPQSLADTIQETNNVNYHLQLIYMLAFVAALGFCLLALISLAFYSCFAKLCLQCPFWFYGFFQMLSTLAGAFGLLTYLYQWYSNKQKFLDPGTRLPIDNELLRLNAELIMLEEFGIAFWVAVGATVAAFLASLLSCLVCCRLPSTRHEDKEYKIMQLPSYS